MHEKLSRGLTFGLIGNVFFILFSIVCFLYYKTFGDYGIIIRFIEIIAYICEAAGFFFMLLSTIALCRTLRMRTWLKIGFSLYIAVELILMILELNSLHFSFYKPYSLLLAIVHSAFSGIVCFSFVSLDSGKKCLEATIIGSIVIILFGMFGNIFGIRIYFGILMNAISFTVLFSLIKWMLSREMIEIDCHGDKARVVEYKSSFF